MADGAYSQRFRKLQKEHMDQCRKARTDEAEDQTTRNHRLHLETARRCKTMALKRKLHQQREEKHRQTILERRRQEMQIVTDKFQRLGRRLSSNSNNNSELPTRGSVTPTLEEALQVVLGRSRPSSAFVMRSSMVANRNSLSSRAMTTTTTTTHAIPASQELPPELITGGKNSAAKWTPVLSVNDTTNNPNVLINRHARPFSAVYLPPNGDENKNNSDGNTVTAVSVGNTEQKAPLQRPQPPVINRWNERRPPTVPTQLRTNTVDVVAVSGLQDFSVSRGLFEQRLNEHQRSLSARHQAALSELDNAISAPAPTAVNSPCSTTVPDLTIANNICVDRALNTMPVQKKTEVKTNDVARLVLCSRTAPPNMNDNLAENYGKDEHGKREVENRKDRQQDGDHSNSAGCHVDSNISRVDSGNGHFESGDGGHFGSVTTNGINLASPSGSETYRTQPSNAISHSTTNQNTMFENAQSNHTREDLIRRDLYVGSPVVNSNTVVDINTLPFAGHSSFFLHRVTSPNVAVVQPSIHSTNHVTAESQKATPLSCAENFGANYVANYYGCSEIPAHLEPRNVGSIVTGHVAAAEPTLSIVNIPSQMQKKLIEVQFVTPAQGATAPHPSPDNYYSSPPEHHTPPTSPPAVNGKPPVCNMQGFSRTASSIPEKPAGTFQRETFMYDEIPIDDTSSISSLMSDAGATTAKPHVGAAENTNENNAVAVMPPKGILKRRPSSCSAAMLGQRAYGLSTAGFRVGSGGLSRSGTASDGSLRDSLEVTKSHLQMTKTPDDSECKGSKKSVRFAEKLCEEEPDRVESYPDDSSRLDNKSESYPADATTNIASVNNLLFYPVPPRQQKPKEVNSRLARPISARITTSTPAVDPSIKIHRTASAGTLRRTNYYRPPATQQQQTVQPNSAPNVNFTKSASVAAANGSTNSAGGKENVGNTGTLNDSNTFNGIRVDRTPTDEEINWLWEKVRNCLNNSRTASNGTGVNNNSSGPANSTQPRHSAVVSQTYIDGTSIATPTVSLQPHRPTSGTYVNNYMGSALPLRRRLVTMDTLSGFSRRPNGMATAQKPSAPAQGVVNAVTAPYAPIAVHTSAAFKPRAMSAPTTGHHTGAGYNNNAGVTESMAGFLAAETLCQTQDVTDSVVSRAMKAAEQKQHMFNSAPQQHVPSALSIEEQRVLQSLERLDEKLKGTENQLHTQLVPRPPPVASSGYQGPQPDRTNSAQQRRLVTYNGTVPRHFFHNAHDSNSLAYTGGQQPMRTQDPSSLTYNAGQQPIR